MSNSMTVQENLDERAKNRMSKDWRELDDLFRRTLGGKITKEGVTLTIKRGADKPYEPCIEQLLMLLRESFYERRTDAYMQSETNAFFRKVDELQNQFDELQSYVEDNQQR